MAVRSLQPGRHMRSNHLGRREVITLLGGATVVWPLVARAQRMDVALPGFRHFIRWFSAKPIQNRGLASRLSEFNFGNSAGSTGTTSRSTFASGEAIRTFSEPDARELIDLVSDVTHSQ